MKKFLVVLLLTWQSLGFAILVPGEVTYLLDQQMVVRNILLDIPARGVGDIHLRATNGEILSTALTSFSGEANGLKKFAIVFDQFPGQKNVDDCFVMWGNYTRSVAEAIYLGYGYILPKSQASTLQSIEQTIGRYPEARLVSNFYFMKKL